MKKIIKIIVPLVLIFVCVTGAFAQGTLSEEILNQAKREAGLFLELKSALGLDWLDEYNAYLENPTSNPEPSWDLSVADLVSGGYLSDSFPSDFTITKAGQEVKISKIITSQAMKDVLPIYLPSVTIAGDVVSLIVQRPEQWVAWQAGLLGKVSRDGSDNPDILPNAVLDFGKGSEIRFINDDGKLTGIENLIYRDDELDDRFVNTSGDDEMSGTLTAGGFKVRNYIVWHEGNDGHREDGSGLDADLLDGEHGSYYLDAKNLTGIVLPKNLDNPGVKYNIDISGKADRAGDSDTLGGEKKEHFATAAHGHSEYLNKTKTEGDTMAGILTAPGFQLNDANTKLAEGAGNSVRVQTNYGYVDIGPTNSGWAHFNTDRASFYFNKPVHATDKLQIYNTNTYLTGTEGKIAGNKIWHAGNDGSGSGLDADLLDGKHLSEIGGIWDVIIEDRKPQGTHGGNFESGAWRTRDLNTLVFNHNSLASLGGNRFTLPAGTYCIDWDAPAAGVGAHKSALYNYTTSTIVAYGTSAYDFNNTVGTTVITITSPTSFEIRHICKTPRHTLGFGMATNFGTEIYTRVCIKKIG